MDLTMNIMLDKRASEPNKAHEEDAGYDLRAAKGYIIYPGHSRVMETGVHIELPKGTVAYVKNRSSLFSKDLMVDGTIDPGYTGPIKVTMFNNGTKAALIKYGDKIAQLTFHETLSPKFKIVNQFKETDRGDGGFGSSGR